MSSVNDAIRNRDNLKQQLADIHARLSLMTPGELNFNTLASEAAGLEFTEQKAEAKVAEQEAEQFAQDVRANTLAESQAVIEAKKQEFRTRNAKDINDLITPDYYNQNQLDKLDALLQEDKKFSEANGIKTAFKNEQLADFACNCESSRTGGKLSPDEKNLTKTHQTVVEGYLYVIYGEKYSPEQVKEILHKQPELIDDAEVYFKKHAQEMGYDCEVHLQCFRDYSDKDRALHEYIMKHLLLPQ